MSSSAETAAPPLGEIGLYDPAVLECPFAHYQRLRSEAPVFRDPATGIYQVSSYELVCQALREPAIYSNAFGAALRGRDAPSPELAALQAEGYPPVDTMLTADPPEHTRYRKLVNKAFSPKRVNAMEGDIARLCDALIDRFAAAGAVELASEFAQALPMWVIAEQLGVPASDMPQFRRWSHAFVVQLSQMADAAGQLEAARQIVAFQHYFAARLAEKRATPTDDVISDLATVTLAEEGDPRPLSVAESLSIIQQILVAGNETTAHAICEGMKLLIDHPDQLAAVKADPALLANLVEETLRLSTPTQNMWRLATRDAALGGVAIPAGAVLLLRFGSANRDERQFDDGEAFDVARDNARRHIAFGQGIHICLGATLARKEMLVAFGRLLQRLDGWRFAPGRNDFAHHPSILLRGMTALHLAFAPR